MAKKNDLNKKLCFLPSKLPLNILPTKKEVIQAINFEHAVNKKTYAEAIKCVVPLVVSLWEKAELPVVNIKTVSDQIKKYFDKYIKITNADKNSGSLQLKVKEFKIASSELFDFSTCKCKSFKLCSCSNERKVPHSLQAFILDQRNRRKMSISSVPTQNKLTQSESVHTIEEPLLNQSDNELEYQIDAPIFCETDSNEELTLRSGRSLNVLAENVDRSQRNNVKLIHTARTADRYHLSNTAVAAIGNSILMDYNVLDSENAKYVIDPNKVRRNRINERQKAINIQQNNRMPLLALYFDGRKDLTKKYENNKIVTKREEHFSLVQQPGSKYIGHVATEKGNAMQVITDILQYLEDHFISINELLAAGSDACPVNIGHIGGVIVLLEKKLGRPLQWLICLLHFNELPLRNMVKALDGGTNGPKTYTGLIGEQLTDCELLDVVEFQSIPFKCDVELSEISHTLSTDQRYLFDICSTISNGFCDSNIASRSPGKLSHSRFITLANRLCRLYISTENPPEMLIVLVEYVVWVFAPTHFNIKSKSSCVFGAIHLANVVKNCSFLRDPYQQVVRNTIENNAFFAHPENILLAILNDEDERIRESGWKKVLEIRHEEVDTRSIRKFRPPKLNFKAKSYKELIDWEKEAKTVPPILRKMNFDSNDPKIYARKKLCEHDLGFDLNELPCHTQSVERCVKLVTEASTAICGAEERNGYVLNTLQSRNQMPKFRSKQDFNLKPQTVPHVSV